MTVHHCPKCDLAFALKAEVEDHCWHDHPEFRHEYPASVHVRQETEDAAAPAAAEAAPAAAAHPRRHLGSGDLARWLTPTRSRH